MTSDRDFTRIAAAWLADGPEELPDRVLDAVVDEIHLTQQRHALRLPRRFPSMTTPARVAAAAAIGMLAIGGAFFVLRPGGSSVGGPGVNPTATQTPSPSPIALIESPTDEPLAAGRYETKPFDETEGGVDDGDLGLCMENQPGCTDTPADNAIRISFTLPEGWRSAPRHSVWLAPEGQGPPGGAWLVFERGAWLYPDPCDTAITPPPTIAVGPTVTDFANALADHPNLDVTTPVDVTLAGYRGKYLDLHVPDDISACPDAYWPYEPGFYAQGPGHRWHLWILDVNGVRVVIRSMDFAATSAEHQAELRAIVESIEIQP